MSPIKRKLQIFVSSTYSDLKEERQAAVSAILKAGHIPAGMELFTAGDQSQLDVIKRWIDESDAYMLVLGTRYGSIEPVSANSYTEVEYDYACSVAKPLSAIVLDDAAIDMKLKSGGSAVVEMLNQNKLEAFRAKVMSRMCSMISDTKDVRAAVYENLFDFERRADLHGWVPGNLIEDSAPLYEQISLLKSDNEQLKTELDNVRASKFQEQPQVLSNPEFDKLKELFQSANLTIPADISTSGEDVERTVMSLFKANRNLFVRGWNLGIAVSDRLKWYEDNVFPPLVVHRLIVSEQRSGGGKRYVATEKGLDFLAWLDGQ